MRLAWASVWWQLEHRHLCVDLCLGPGGIHQGNWLALVRMGAESLSNTVAFKISGDKGIELTDTCTGKLIRPTFNLQPQRTAPQANNHSK